MKQQQQQNATFRLKKNTIFINETNSRSRKRHCRNTVTLRFLFFKMFVLYSRVSNMRTGIVYSIIGSPNTFFLRFLYFVYRIITGFEQKFGGPEKGRFNGVRVTTNNAETG